MSYGRVASLGLLLLLTLVLAGSPLSVYACSCASLEPPRLFQWADVVFIGKVTHVELSNVTSSFGPSNAVTFNVSSVLKGFIEEGTQTVIVPQSEGACGYLFGVNKVYEVNARFNNHQLNTNLCDGNRVIGSPSDSFIPLASPFPDYPKLGVLALLAVVLVVVGLTLLIVTRRKTSDQPNPRPS